MKTNRLAIFLGLSAILGFTAACEKSDDMPAGNSADFTIRLSVDGVSTRTGIGTVADEESESAVDNVRLFIVKDDYSEIHELSFAEGGDVEADDDNELEYHAHLDRTLYKGNWLVYAIANWPSNITLNKDSYASFIGSYTGLTDEQLASMWSSGHFPMVNMRNSKTETGKDNGGVLVELKAEDVEVTPVANIRLERIAAKVCASVDPYISYGIIGTEMGASTAVFGVSRVVFDGVAMINNVNSFNLIQQWTDGGALITPSSDGDYTGYYNTAVPPTEWKAPGTVMYCLENNAPDYAACGGEHLDAASGTRMKGRVTGLIIRAKVETLSEFTSEADTDPTIDPEDAEKGENLIVDPDPGVWKSVKTRGGASSDAEFRTIYKYKGVYFADWQQLFAQNPSLGSVEADAASATLRAKGVTVYENGYMYYTYWIETEGDQYVARNVFYDLSIKSVNAFGDDLPGGAYVSTDPLKTDDPKITVSLKISGWDEKTNQDYTL